MQHRAMAGWATFVAVWAWAGSAGAQQGTDIYVGSLSLSGGRLAVTGLKNATNRDGYDNQPSFGPSGTFFLYTSGRSGGQTDIFRYDIASGTSRPITRTPESEYSPTMMPGGASFSVIRVEADSAQRLWSFGMDGRNPTLLLEDIMPVGYHAWGDNRTLALFVLGSPPTLQLADANTGRADVIEERIGRSIHRIPGQRAISFVHKVAEDEWWIKRLDLRTQEVTPLVQTLTGSEDYAWTPGGIIVMGRGSVLFQWDGGAAAWSEVADLSSQGVEEITRIAVSPAGDWIAIVGVRREK
ncbi:MAG: PD40 domain-containing protein [Gemmatimonadetes bacterium]|nr:PD40 domain-containing protein [Gemmatimonadota bacterium]